MSLAVVERLEAATEEAKSEFAARRAELEAALEKAKVRQELRSNPRSRTPFNRGASWCSGGGPYKETNHGLLPCKWRWRLQAAWPKLTVCTAATGSPDALAVRHPCHCVSRLRRRRPSGSWSTKRSGCKEGRG